MSEIPVERHPLQPFLPAKGRLLMLGSFPPPKTRWCMDFYYPNFTNDMWRIVGLVFFGDALHFVDTARRTYRLPQLKAFLQATGIGLYDTVTAVRRLQGTAADKDLEVVEATDVAALLAAMPACRAIVTTGEKATLTLADAFHAVPPRVGTYTTFSLRGDTFRLYRMPSSSRAYPMRLERKAAAYRAMFADLFALPS